MSLPPLRYGRSWSCRCGTQVAASPPGMCVCVCVCQRERRRERRREGRRKGKRWYSNRTFYTKCVCVCVFACVCVCTWERERVYVCVYDRERERGRERKCVRDRERESELGLCVLQRDRQKYSELFFDSAYTHTHVIYLSQPRSHIVCQRYTYSVSKMPLVAGLCMQKRLNIKAFLRNRDMTCNDKASFGSSRPCITYVSLCYVIHTHPLSLSPPSSS